MSPILHNYWLATFPLAAHYHKVHALNLRQLEPWPCAYACTCLRLLARLNQNQNNTNFLSFSDFGPELQDWHEVKLCRLGVQRPPYPVTLNHFKTMRRLTGFAKRKGRCEFLCAARSTLRLAHCFVARRATGFLWALAGWVTKFTFLQPTMHMSRFDSRSAVVKSRYVDDPPVHSLA